MEKDDITEALARMANWQHSHEIEDNIRHEENLARFEMIGKNMASKEDTKEILDAVKAVHFGAGIIKIGWRTFKTIGVIGGSIVAVIAFWKFIAMWLISLLLVNK